MLTPRFPLPEPNQHRSRTPGGPRRLHPLTSSSDPFAAAPSPLLQSGWQAHPAPKPRPTPSPAPPQSTNWQPHPLCILFSYPATSSHLRQRARILAALDSNGPPLPHATASRRVTGQNLFRPSCFATIVKVLVTRSACPNSRCQQRRTFLWKSAQHKSSAAQTTTSDEVDNTSQASPNPPAPP